MTAKSKLSLCAAMLAMGCGCTSAQDALPGVSEYMYADAMALWRHTVSAAGLTLDSLTQRGYSSIGVNHQSGDYHRVQEGRQTNSVGFYSERYQSIGRYLYGYGSFAFEQGRTKGRAWSDVMRTYGSNPFLSGSSVAGAYDEQNLDFVASVGTVDLAGWRYGIRLDYRVGDLSRLRDPRSRSRMLDFRLAPAVCRTFGIHSVGVSAWYRRYKEKLPGIITVQNNPNLYYYQMSGMEAVTGTVGGYSGYSREYVNHECGGEVQYAMRRRDYAAVYAANITYGTESMFEQYEREPGHYYTYQSQLQSRHRVTRGTRVHQIDWTMDAAQAYADEYRPQLVVTLDADNGYSSYRYDNLLTYRKRYQMQSLSAHLSYRLAAVRAAAVQRYLQAECDWSSISQKHLLPTSTFDWSTVRLGAEYGQTLFPSRRLWLTARVGYLVSARADMDLADATTPYAQSVLLPDMTYYRSNCLNAGLDLLYQHPLQLKGYRFVGFVRVQAQTWQAQHDLSSQAVGLSIGIMN